MSAAENILSAKPIYTDIDGAPFSIHQKVVVVDVIDPETISRNEDDIEELIGKTGRLEYYEYECGCGQTYPHDPMMGVRFDDNTLIEFWSEELATAE